MNCKNVIGAQIVKVVQQRDPDSRDGATYNVDRIYLSNGYVIVLSPYETDVEPGVEGTVRKASLSDYRITPEERP